MHIIIWWRGGYANEKILYKRNDAQDTGKRKLTFKERKEFEELEKQIPMLEEEKSCLETEMSSGVLSTDELIEKSNRIAVLIDLIDEKTMRWLELSEMQ